MRGAVAGFLYRMVLDDDEVAAKKSLAVVMALYRNNTWRDSKAVGVVAAIVVLCIVAKVMFGKKPEKQKVNPTQTELFGQRA